MAFFLAIRDTAGRGIEESDDWGFDLDLAHKKVIWSPTSWAVNDCYKWGEITPHSAISGP